jgi:hypothetical protein
MPPEFDRLWDFEKKAALRRYAFWSVRLREKYPWASTPGQEVVLEGFSRRNAVVNLSNA